MVLIDLLHRKKFGALHFWRGLGGRRAWLGASAQASRVLAGHDGCLDVCDRILRSSAAL